MNREELAKQVLPGLLLIVGEYRGSRAENAGYVDKKVLRTHRLRATGPDRDNRKRLGCRSWTGRLKV
jgi:hypothetical protein